MTTYYPDYSLSESFQHNISKDEAMLCYAGISPDPPKLVYRTGKKQWFMPRGPDAFTDRTKKLRGVFDHKTNDVWNTLGLEVRSRPPGRVLWSSIEVVRFRTGAAAVLGRVVLWIGVLPNTLTGEGAFTRANSLLELLKRHGITDVDIEYRESVYRRSVGSPLLESVRDMNSIVDVVGPLTAALGIHIAGSTTPDFQGTMCFYLAEGGESKDILAVTARHVLFPPNEPNIDYVHSNNSTHRTDVPLMGTEAFENSLTSINLRISIYERQIEHLEEWVAGDDQEEDVMKAKDLTKKERLWDRAIKASSTRREGLEQTEPTHHRAPIHTSLPMTMPFWALE